MSNSRLLIIEPCIIKSPTLLADKTPMFKVYANEMNEDDLSALFAFAMRGSCQVIIADEGAIDLAKNEPSDSSPTKKAPLFDAETEEDIPESIMGKNFGKLDTDKFSPSQVIRNGMYIYWEKNLQEDGCTFDEFYRNHCRIIAEKYINNLL